MLWDTHPIQKTQALGAGQCLTYVLPEEEEEQTHNLSVTTTCTRPLANSKQKLAHCGANWFKLDVDCTWLRDTGMGILGSDAGTYQRANS